MTRVDPFLGLAAVKEAARRQKAAAGVDFRKLCFPQQLKFVEDQSPFVVGCTSRRAGKSEGVALKLVTWAQSRPNVMVPYVTISRPMAKRIMWPKLKEWDKRLGLQAHFNNALLEMTLPNGSVIFLGSADTDDEIEKLRGGAYPGVALDEVQSFRPGLLRALIDDILVPALVDYDGQLLLTGTPSAACAGYFHDCATGRVPGYSVHHWTMFQNPHLPNALTALNRYLTQRKLRASDPKIRREWFGEWVRDSERSVFHLPDAVLLPALPAASDWEYVVGVDFGYIDACAFVVQAYSVQLGVCVTVDAFERTGLLTGDAALVVKGLYDLYEPVHLVGDMGGLGKPYAEEIIQRFDLPMEPAEKTRKLSAIELLNSDLRGGAARIMDTCVALWEQARSLEWSYEKVMKKRGISTGDDEAELRHVTRADLAISDRTPNHLADAWLYSYRACYQYLHQGTSGEATDPTMSPEELEMERALESRLSPREPGLHDEVLPGWMSRGLLDPRQAH